MIPVKWGKPFQRPFGSLSGSGKLANSGHRLAKTACPVLLKTGMCRRPWWLLRLPSPKWTKSSPEFKRAGSRVVLLPLPRDEQELPDFAAMKRIFQQVQELIAQGGVLASSTVKEGGLAAAISQMCFGNNIGMIFQENHELELDRLFAPDYGSLILEIKNGVDLEEAFRGVAYRLLGRTREKSSIEINGIEIPLAEAVEAWESTLDKVFL